MKQFPNEIAIAYAICNADNNCNNKEFIVDGQSQICNDCGELLFREKTRNYTLKEEAKNECFKDEVYFPDSIVIAYATCNNGDCDYGEFVVIKDVVKCQYCGNPMKLHGEKRYYLSSKMFICPICGYDRLFFEPYNKNGLGSYDICPNCETLFFNNKTDKIEIKRKNYLRKEKKSKTENRN